MMDLFDQWSEDELFIIDIAHLGLEIEAWDYKRGAKTERLYKDAEGNVKVKIFYTYTFEDSNRKAVPTLRTIEWYDVDDTVKLSKSKNLIYSTKSLKSVQREIRQGRIDHLEGSAEELRTLADLLPEPQKSQYITVADNIDFLFTHYEHAIQEYIKRGTMEFENAINSETDPTLLSIFDIPVYPADSEFPNGLTVKESLLYQLNGTIP